MLACGLDGLLSVDFSDPAAPRLLAALSLPLSASSLGLQGESGYVSDDEGRLLQLDLRDPARPRPQGRLDHAFEILGFAVIENQAMLAAGFGGMVSVPLPQTLQTLERDARSLSLALPAVATLGYYTLQLSDGGQSVVLPEAFALGQP